VEFHLSWNLFLILCLNDDDDSCVRHYHRFRRWGEMIIDILSNQQNLPCMDFLQPAYVFIQLLQREEAFQSEIAQKP
jgi:hypothetical protein